MNVKIIFYILAGFLFVSGIFVTADEISLSSGQSDYYYKIGTDARVPFTIDSTFPGTLGGTLQYSLTRHQADEGFSISQTNTQSQSFPIAPGKTSHAITLTSETETDYDLSLLLLYQDKGKDYAVVLPSLTVHFVQDPRQFSPDKKTVRSSTTEATKTPASPLTDPFSQMEREMQQMREEQQQLMQSLFSQGFSGMSSGSSPGYQNPSQALQNNQMPASTSALKQQMMEETRQNEENKRELADSLEKDPILRQQSKDLRDTGYNQTSGRVSPTGPGSGGVEISYENTEGEKVLAKGEAVDGKIKSLTAEKTGEIPVPSELDSNSTWNELKDKLEESSMLPSSGSVTRNPEETIINQQFQGPDGRNATITARMVNGTVEEITLKKDEEFPMLWAIGLILLLLLIVLCLGVTWWYYTTRESGIQEYEEKPSSDEVRHRPLEMLRQAEECYVSGEKKEGYVLLGQAIRMHISDNYGKGDAITIKEIISGSRTFDLPHKAEISEIIEILKTCSLIEYAKEEPEDELFFRFLNRSHEFISEGLSES